MNKALAAAISLALAAPVVAADTAPLQPLVESDRDLATVARGRLEGMAVYGSHGVKAGNVDRLVVAGGEQAVVIGLDGLIGDGAKEVVVPFSRLAIDAGGQRLVAELTDAELRTLPDVDPGDLPVLDAPKSFDALDDGRDEAANAANTPSVADNLAGRDVLGPQGDRVGTIDSVVMRATGATAIVGIDTVPGAAPRDVAVPLERISHTDDRRHLIVNYSQDQLDALPSDESRSPAAPIAGPGHRDPTAGIARDVDRHRAVDTHAALAGTNVVSIDGEAVGDVDRVEVRDGKQTAIIGLDGTADDGAREVAVPLSEMTRSADGLKLVMNTPRRDFDARRHIEQGEY